MLNFFASATAHARIYERREVENGADRQYDGFMLAVYWGRVDNSHYLGTTVQHKFGVSRVDNII